jgi:hypothetical protein
MKLVSRLLLVTLVAAAPAATAQEPAASVVRPSADALLRAGPGPVEGAAVRPPAEGHDAASTADGPVASRAIWSVVPARAQVLPADRLESPRPGVVVALFVVGALAAAYVVLLLLPHFSC